MPFATSRVGAMPPPSRADGQPSAQHQQSGGRARSQRQKGITMEDLKKQTALRLAQEQQHGQALPGSSRTAAVAGDPRTRHPVVTPQTLAARRMAATSSHAAAPPVSRDNLPVHHYQRLHHHNNPIVHHIPNTVEAPGMAAGYGAAPHYYDQPQGGKNPSAGRNTNPRQAKFAEMSLAEQHQAQGMAASNGRYHSDHQRSQYLRSTSAPVLPGNPLSSNASGYNSASANLGVQSGSTSKLPHGLTVHELKEMTKARLQAEAADRMSMSSGSDRPPSASVVEMEAREASSGGQQDAMQVQTNSIGYDQGSSFRQPAQVSPIPPTLHGYGHGTSSFNDTAAPDQRNRNRVDSFPDSNWENASVTSHNSTVASEYLGSESAFSSGVNSGYPQLDDPSAMSLGRTQSYPLGNGRPAAVSADMTSRENTPTSIPSPMGASYFDSSASMSQNRQRAMTLSPRPGLSLLHEDRPGFNEDELGIPSFSSSSRHGHARQPLTARSRRSFSPVLQQPQAFVSEGYGGGYGGGNLPGVIGGGNVVENRPRTSSTASLPAISHTAEEFAGDANIQASSRRSSDSASMMGPPPIREHSVVSGTGGDALLGSSSLYSSMDGRSQQTSSVFRNDYGGIPAPPGLGHDSIAMSGSGTNPLASRTGSMDSMGSNRVRAATWAPAPSSDVFGSSSGLYDYPGDDTLAGDLASILKLSGAEEKADVEHPGMFHDTPGSFLGGNSRGF